MTRSFVLCVLLSLLPASVMVAQSSQAAPAATAPAATAQPGPEHPQASDHTLEDGIPVKLQLSANLSSASAKAGQEIAFDVVEDIDIDGVTVLRRGTSAIGVVTEAAAKGRLGRAGKLNFTISYVQLVDGEKAPLRAVSNTSGESRTDAMIGNMVAMPVVAAPFFLLMKGGDTSFSKGTEITAFIDGDMHVDLARFKPASQSVAQTAGPQSSLVIESTPAGAGIELDGAPVGNTPFTVAVAPGNHRISVRKKGFVDWSKSLDVTTGTVQVRAELVVEVR